MTKEQIEEAAKEYSGLTDNPKDSFRERKALCVLRLKMVPTGASTLYGTTQANNLKETRFI